MLLGATALGALLCLVKGEGGGLTMAVGNLSAPYVIVAVCAGLAAPRWWLGTVLGVLATEATVAGFYGTWATGFGHEVSPSAVMLWGGAGVVTGAAFGLVGWAARARPGLRSVLPALLLLEPVLTQVGSLITSPLLHIGYAGQIDAREWVAYAIEVALGVVVLTAARTHVRHVRRSGGSAGAA